MMKILFMTIGLVAASSASATTPVRAYPSCDLVGQHALRAQGGGKTQDAAQAYIVMRANVLQADIGSARKARRLSQGEANSLWKRIEAVRANVAQFVAKQGFLSAAERATYDRQLDAVAAPICRTGNGSR